jgi:hypothetical protein
VDGEPRNASSEFLDSIVDRMNSEFEMMPSWMTDDFVRQDRRRLVATPESNGSEFVENVRAWFSVGAGTPRFRVAEVYAVAGDRCVTHRVSIDFDGSFASDMIHSIRCNASVDKMQKIVTFDPDDLDAALAELERLHAEIEPEGTEPST